MRTNIVINDQLMQDALSLTGLSTKRDVVELALKTLVQLKKQTRVRALRGKLEWEGDLEWSRLDK
ncbi:MAG: type II toxin-antitoxin system VapB family antitoxin [Gammaproteobacteria bacterium]|jgi:Arc/MetJ family transcription regulator